MYKHFLLAFLSGQRTHSASCLVHKHGAQVWRDCQLSSGFFTRSLLIKLRERFLCTTFTIKNYCTAAVTIRLRSCPLVLLVFNFFSLYSPQELSKRLLAVQSQLAKSGNQGGKSSPFISFSGSASLNMQDFVWICMLLWMPCHISKYNCVYFQ